jgi:molybdopterin synthase sulfur carrier subunit
VEAADVASLVEALETKHKGLRDRLYDGAGELRSYVRVFLNDEDIRFLDGKKTALKAGDTVTIVPAIAGGR